MAQSLKELQNRPEIFHLTIQGVRFKKFTQMNFLIFGLGGQEFADFSKRKVAGVI
jgi:hypothetical protein